MGFNKWLTKNVLCDNIKLMVFQYPERNQDANLKV